MPDFTHSNEREVLQNRNAADNTSKNGISFSPPTLQLKAADEEEEVQMKAAPVQKKSNGLPEEVQQKMEGAMGADFSGVNIHQNSSSAESLNALAYTQGNDVHFASGQYNPETSAGQELIGHELAHVVQQSQGRVEPTIQEQGYNINNDKGLESEADIMGSKAASFQLKKEDSDDDE